ncbi:MAG TPA: hypothetical protein VJN43_09465 [Bryobacteraceae bacterium]|nr:hypothetical protein [Bryobacteraceae bacterium]
MALKQVDPGHWTGPPEELGKFKDVRDVLAALCKVGIELPTYHITITDVYSRAVSARPYGFDFLCQDAKRLLGDVQLQSKPPKLAMRFDDYSPDKTQPVFNEDKDDTLEGRVAGGVTEGRGFREIGTGARLHLEISATAGAKCNVHIDSHGFVAAPGVYDWVLGVQHGYWDLGSHYLPGLYGSIGKRGRIGIMVRPIRGPRGEIRWIAGFMGEW